jgi:hypothetical protein
VSNVPLKIGNNCIKENGYYVLSIRFFERKHTVYAPFDNEDVLVSEILI